MRCRACQEHANIQHHPAIPLHPIESPYPFAQWGMNIVGPFPQRQGKESFNSDRGLLYEVDELPSILWAYRTTPRVTIGESPFNLTYGIEAIAPAEIREPSWRMTNYAPQHNDITLRVNLDLIEELREKVASRSEMYKARMARAYNMKVHSRSFQVGNLILRKPEVLRHIRKLDPKWEAHIR
ncbi:hypothetical protein Pfo_000426 [Paulownia fortunei]|nr:hypothetical protein Pfo_000426 [Paulownia fortunei]